MERLKSEQGLAPKAFYHYDKIMRLVSCGNVIIDHMTALVTAWLFAMTKPAITVDLFTDSFRAELEEYHDGVIRGRKALGVLIRGTDYIASKLGGVRQMASAEQMIPTIREWGCPRRL